MKCISLWQPWSTAVVLGKKRIETRGWETMYRGPLLIHAGKRKVHSEILDQLIEFHWFVALKEIGGMYGMNLEYEKYLPFGAIVGKVDVVACKRVEDLTPERKRVYGEHPLKPLPPYDDFTEELLGDFSPGRFGWVLENPVRFKEPIPYRGYQRFFDVPEDLVREAVPA